MFSQILQLFPRSDFHLLVKELKPSAMRVALAVGPIYRDFQTAVSTIVEARHTGLFNLFNPEIVTLKDLFTAIRSAVGSRTL